MSSTLTPPTSSTTTTSSNNTGIAAHVNFRVRCETLGHGEDVYLVRSQSDSKNTTGNDDTTSTSTFSMQKQPMIPLYTTAASYPWYHTIKPVTVTLPPRVPKQFQQQQQEEDDDDDDPSLYFKYRYVVYRAGVFYRLEQPSDAGKEDDEDEEEDTAMQVDTTTTTTTTTASTNNNNNDIDVTTTTATPLHSLPLRLLSHRESYVINDVLGKVGGHPDVDHITVPNRQVIGTTASRHPSRQPSAVAGSSDDDVTTTTTTTDGKKKVVGFAPAPPTYHAHPATVQEDPSTLPPPPPSTATPSNSTTKTTNKTAVHLNSTDGLVVVSAFLPVVLHRSDVDGSWTADWDYEALLSMQTHLRVTRIGVVKWRGWHGNFGISGATGTATNSAMSAMSSGVPVGERHLVEECLRPFHCVPVWIDTVVFGEMYNGFCKGVLWPVLHNVTSVYSSQPDQVNSPSGLQGGSSSNMGGGKDHQHHPQQQQFSEYSMDDVEQGPIHGGRGREKELWAAYNTVNRKFAEVVVQCFNEGDLVWVHGFHLLILPSYLTRRIPMAKVGIFLHTPFPSSEIFRTLWCRDDLLRGILNADQVGFHLFEYARHFLTCCRRLLGLNYGMIPDSSGGHTLAIDQQGRHVIVTSIHAGIEPPVLNQILHHETTFKEASQIRSEYAGKTIFCSIDRLESLKGIPLKLLAIERFLRRCPEWIGKIVLIQVGISAFERGDDYVKTRNEVMEMVTRINELWPGTVHFQESVESKMRLQQRMALMRAADVVLATPIRDGLNLIPLEFTIAHQDALTPQGQADGRKRGLVILSEFASCTRVMRGALHVNPWKISEIANAFRSCLVMTDDERMRRISCACEFVTRVTTQRWALAVMLDLKGVHKSVNPVQYSGAGLGLGYRLLGMDASFPNLDFRAVAKAFKSSKNRLILLDYGGTITNNENLDNLSRFRMVKTRSAHSEPTPEIMHAIEDLCSDSKNTVFVVSGKERHSLLKCLGHIPRLGLAAEHGMFISWPTKDVSAKRQWETLVPITDRSWRALAMAIMEVYASRTHGSYIEETEMKVLWQYRDADLEFGYLQARELEDHLSNVLRSFPVDILHGGMEEGGYVEVRPKGVNKGVFAMKLIRNFEKVSSTRDGKVDFALVLGDDHCDEPMLSIMRQIGRRGHESRTLELPTTMTLVDVSSCDSHLASNLEVFTCTVGKKPSAAANYLQDVSEVEELLQALVKVSRNMTLSMLDFAELNAMQPAAEPLVPIPHHFGVGNGTTTGTPNNSISGGGGATTSMGSASGGRRRSTGSGGGGGGATPSLGAFFENFETGGDEDDDGILEF